MTQDSIAARIGTWASDVQWSDVPINVRERAALHVSWTASDWPSLRPEMSLPPWPPAQQPLQVMPESSACLNV